MAVDTPAKIAILGAGPIGLEAALYARFLGYNVCVYEQGTEIAAAVQAWGHVKMFTPFGMNRSSLGLAALAAQDEAYQPPQDDELISGRQWRERYLAPLSQSDLLADHVRLGERVIRIGKEQLLKGDLVGNEERGDWSFHLLVRDKPGRERIDEADVVIDASGVFCGPTAWLGEGGIPAVGEMELTSQGAIEHGLPDFADKDRANYSGKHTLLVGAGYSAATNVVALAELARESPGTRVTWVTRKALPSSSDLESRGPISIFAGDRLPQRDALARRANSLSVDSSGAVNHLPETELRAVTRRSEDSPFEVRLTGRCNDTLSCDRIIASVGYRPDRAVYEELLVHECYATHGPMKLSAALLGQPSGDCLDQRGCGPHSLLSPEPNFFILGSKSYGRKSNFLFATGLEQIRDVFSILGDRPNLDLYATAPQRRS